MTLHKFKRIARQINLKPTTLSYMAAEGVICDNESVTQVCERLGVSKQLVHQVMKNIRMAEVEFTDVEQALIRGGVRDANHLLEDLLKN